MPETDSLLNDYHTYSSEEDSDYLIKDKKAAKADLKKKERNYIVSINLGKL